MMSLKNQHWPQPHRPLPAPPDIDTKPLRPLHEIVAARTIPRYERALPLPPQILNLVWIPFRQALEAVVEIVACVRGVPHEIQAFDLLDDGAEEDGARGVAHPGVELAVRFVGPQLRVAEVVARGLGFFREGDHVRRVVQVPVVMGPKFARGADAGLHFVDDEEDVVFFGDVAEAFEEGGGGVVVPALGLDGFDDDGRDGVVEVGDQIFRFGEAAGFFRFILGAVFVEGVFEVGKGGLGPVEGGNIEFVDGLATGSGEGGEEAAVEGGTEGEDAHVWRTWGLIVHGGGDLVGGEVNRRATALLASFPHEGCLVGGFVRIGAGHGCENLVETFRSDSQDAGLENIGPVMLGEVAKGGAIDHGAGHLWGCC